MNKEIKPLEGVGDVKFGMTLDEIKTVLGNPDEIEKDMRYGDLPNEVCDVAYYDELGASFSFDKKYKYKMTECIFEDEAYTLGEICVNMNAEKVMDLAESMELGDWYEEELEPEDGGNEATAYTFEDAGVTFWFEGERLASIQLNAEQDEKGDIVWPE